MYSEQISDRLPCHAVPHCCRSTFPGAGRFAGHWTGDNAANWQSFADSISGILNSNMWGLAMTGADICGFVDMEAYTGRDLGPLTQRLSDKDFQQLCVRWARTCLTY
jgi:alpha-glucosidase (family GH31 glycosyl hydrolase)